VRFQKTQGPKPFGCKCGFNLHGQPGNRFRQFRNSFDVIDNNFLKKTSYDLMLFLKHNSLTYFHFNRMHFSGPFVHKSQSSIGQKTNTKLGRPKLVAWFRTSDWWLGCKPDPGFTNLKPGQLIYTPTFPRAGLALDQTEVALVGATGSESCRITGTDDDSVAILVAN